MRFLKSLLFTTFLIIIITWIVNQYIIVKTQPYISSTLTNLPIPENILVLGASVYRSGKLSPVLQERMEQGLFAAHSFTKTNLILSGHAIFNGYNEPLSMQKFAIRQKLEPHRIHLDPKGFSTYRSLINYKKQFKNTPLIIVSQKGHLHRAIYIAQQLGLTAYGFTPKTPTPFSFREAFSRVKDYFFLKFSRLFV